MLQVLNRFRSRAEPEVPALPVEKIETALPAADAVEPQVPPASNAGPIVPPVENVETDFPAWLARQRPGSLGRAEETVRALRDELTAANEKLGIIIQTNLKQSPGQSGFAQINAAQAVVAEVERRMAPAMGTLRQERADFAVALRSALGRRCGADIVDAAHKLNAIREMLKAVRRFSEIAGITEDLPDCFRSLPQAEHLTLLANRMGVAV